jgi:hypothetical protein
MVELWFLEFVRIIIFGVFFQFWVQTSSCQFFKSNNHHVQVWALTWKSIKGKERQHRSHHFRHMYKGPNYFYQVPTSKLFLLRQKADMPTPKHRRQLTTWQVFLSSREDHLQTDEAWAWPQVVCGLTLHSQAYVHPHESQLWIFEVTVDVS